MTVATMMVARIVSLKTNALDAPCDGCADEPCADCSAALRAMTRGAAVSESDSEDEEEMLERLRLEEANQIWLSQAKPP